MRFSDSLSVFLVLVSLGLGRHSAAQTQDLLHTPHTYTLPLGPNGGFALSIQHIVPHPDGSATVFGATVDTTRLAGVFMLSNRSFMATITPQGRWSNVHQIANNLLNVCPFTRAIQLPDRSLIIQFFVRSGTAAGPFTLAPGTTIGRITCEGKWRWVRSFNTDGGFYAITGSGRRIFASGSYAFRSVTLGGFVLPWLGNGANGPNGPNFLACLDTAGNYQWAKPINGGVNFVGGSNINLASGPGGAIYVGAGGRGGSLAFGPDTLTFDNTAHSGFLARFDSAGNYLWGRKITNMGPEHLLVNKQGIGFIGGAINAATAAIGPYMLQALAGNTIAFATFDAQGAFIGASRMGSAQGTGFANPSLLSDGSLAVTFGNQGEPVLIDSITLPRDTILPGGIAIFNTGARAVEARRMPCNMAVGAARGGLYLTGFSSNANRPAYPEVALPPGYVSDFLSYTGPVFCPRPDPSLLTFSRRDTSLSLSGLPGCVQVQYLYREQPVAGATSPRLRLSLPRDTGWYQVRITLSGGCDTLTNRIHVTDSGAVIVGNRPTAPNGKLQVRPCPATAFVTVQAMPGQEARLYSAHGQLIREVWLDGQGLGTASIAQLPKGVYIVKSNGAAVRVVKE